MIVLDGVTKTYNAGKSNAFTALEGISGTIEAGRMTVITGPSGSGKSTLLSLIGCMSRPTSGRVFFEGREITSLPERFLAEIRRREFGFVFQDYNLIRGLGVLENVMLPGFPLGIPRRELKTRAGTLLEMLEIRGLESRNVTLLSGGEQQRVALARALMNDPEILLADEPTGSLDSKTGAQVLECLFTFSRERSRTLVIVTHNADVAGACRRTIRMMDGRIVE